MAKGKNNITTLKPWLLFLISATLLAAGWLMKPFPIFIFFGIAPLFAIADQAKDGDDFWVYIEFILLALVVCFFSATTFNSSSLIVAILHAILFALAFLGYSFCYQNLGSRLGKFTIIFFWLALEYLLLKLPWREQSIFLADAVQLKTEWLGWSSRTGYLGASLWILCTNLLVYIAVFKGKVNWYLVAVSVIFLTGPVIYSYSISVSGVSRAQMISLYSIGKVETSSYFGRGELVSRTAAWISVLILLMALVKNQTKKK
jgi:apolipoprotein N-acyltransferase